MSGDPTTAVNISIRRELCHRTMDHVLLVEVRSKDEERVKRARKALSLYLVEHHSEFRESDVPVPTDLP